MENSGFAQVPSLDGSEIDAISLFSILKINGVCTIKNYGYDPTALDKIMYSVGLARFVDDFGRNQVDLQVDPREASQADRPLAGEFHTDFSQYPFPPQYLVICCKKPDPRHPFYGRNQVVKFVDILRNVKELSEELYLRLSVLTYPCIIRGKLVHSRLIDRTSRGDYIVRYHPGYIAHDCLTSEHYFKSKPITEWIHHIAMAKCFDFALDMGDCLIASNHFCLHRRDTATVHINKEFAPDVSRQIKTWRYV